MPLTRPTFGDEEARAPIESIRSGWVTQGPKVAEFEHAVAVYVGAKAGVAVSSGTAGLHLALHALGIGAGDEVIVPSLSFIASANAVLHAGAEVVFCEVEAHTFTIDPGDVERRVTSRTRAIMPVDQIGLACDLDAMAEIAKARRLELVEDAAPAIGATYKGRRVGAGPHQVVFSFHPRKVITTGEGGMIMTSDEDLAVRLRTLRQHGMSVSDLSRRDSADAAAEEFPEVGFNYRMSDVHAAIGVAQMGRLDEVLAARKVRAERYNRELPGIGGIQIPYVPPYAEHTYQSYMITLAPECPLDRSSLIERLRRRGIGARTGIMASHLEGTYKSRYGQISLPVTEQVARTTVLLPLYATMTEDEQTYVIDALRAELGPS